ncbi:MAG: NUDIX domain-containing protein [Nanoarchaeota archaeon]
MKKIYVAGFLFSKDGDLVALVEKNRPDWQKGKLNAIGGKVEDGEDPLSAMQREFKEEAGVDIRDWTPFCVLVGNDEEYNESGSNFEVHFFSCFSNEILNVKTMEDEEVAMYVVDQVQTRNIVPNLKWLIPMAFEKGLMAKVFDGIKV